MSARPSLEPEWFPLPTHISNLVPYWYKSNILRHITIGLWRSNGDIIEQLQADGRVHGEDIQAGIDVARQWFDPLRPLLNPGDSRALRINLEVLRRMEHEQNPELSLRTLELSPMQKRRYSSVPEDVIHQPLKELMQRENGTTQWASAVLLLQERPKTEIKELFASVRDDQRLMLEKSLSIRSRWLEAEKIGTHVQLDDRDRDHTIWRHAVAFYTTVRNGSPVKIFALHSEDVYVAVFSGALTPEAALARYPQIVDHEVNRYEEAKRLLSGDRSKPLDTEDHRAAHAALMLLGYNSWTDKTARAVRKTWPQFFEFRHAVLRASSPQ